MFKVVCIPASDDNYIWFFYDAPSKEGIVIDPCEADPVLREARKRGWPITQIWNTHWHGDHVNGNEAIKAATGCKVTGPAAEAARIATLDILVGEGDRAQVGTHRVDILDVPGHTLGHIAYHLRDAAMLFVGDTLFPMGCGRLFEGDACQMHDNLQRFALLPPSTRVFCAHEYAAANGRFALTVEPHNEALRARMVEVERMRALGQATVPTTIALELATNPFMRSSSAEQLAERRLAKDRFRG